VSKTNSILIERGKIGWGGLVAMGSKRGEKGYKKVRVSKKFLEPSDASRFNHRVTIWDGLNGEFTNRLIWSKHFSSSLYCTI